MNQTPWNGNRTVGAPGRPGAWEHNIPSDEVVGESAVPLGYERQHLEEACLG